jgi:hypothetical protein
MQEQPHDARKPPTVSSPRCTDRDWSRNAFLTDAGSTTGIQPPFKHISIIPSRPSPAPSEGSQFPRAAVRMSMALETGPPLNAE